MTSKPTRLLAAALALLLALSAPSAALAAELPAPGGIGEAAQPLEITVPDYIPTRAGVGDGVDNIKKGGLYTLIVLPRTEESSARPPLTSELLLGSDPLFIGWAVASDNGKVTFTNIRLRTAEASIYYVTGPGLDTPLAETTGLSVAVSGSVKHTVLGTLLGVDNATVSLLDKDTGYAYANSVSTRSDGGYYFENLSPGEYYLHVEKPGYIPATDSRGLSLADDTTASQTPFDISSFLGDVNGDAKRDIADMTALLFCYGKPLSGVPAGYCPDLYEDSAINLLDTALLIDAMITYDSFPKGVGQPTNATVSVKDTADVSQTNRALTFSLNDGGSKGLTFTAASVTLSFRTDYIQPINQNGGAVNPANLASAANCLVPKSGVTISDARWSVSGDLATLTFSFSCAKPTVLTDLVELRYRPAPGKTVNDFFEGVFTVDHAAAQVGEAIVLTKDEFNLEYPQSSAPELDSITIDQTSSQLTIPTEWRTAVLALSATGHMGGTAYPNLSGVTWVLADSYRGVSISNSLLTVTHEAQAGDIQLTASLGGVTSAPLTVTLKNAPAVPSRISITDSEGSVLTSDVLEGPAGTALTSTYQAQVFDQYSAAMEGETVTWSLSGAPDGISVSTDGTLTAASLPAGEYTFSLHAGLDSYNLRATALITLTLEPELQSLVLSGSASAPIPSGAEPLILSYILSALDAQGNPMPTGSLSPSFTVTKEGAGSDQPTGVSATVDMTGNLTVTVDSTAQPGKYTLLVAEGEVTASFTLTLQQAQEDSATLPVRAALSYDGQVSDTLEFTLTHSNINGYLRIDPVLLNRDGQQVDPAEQSWITQIADRPDGLIDRVGTNGRLDLQVEDSLPCGTYLFTITALDSVSGLQVTVPVTLTLVPRLETLTLNAPATLPIPTSGDLRYTITFTAEGSDGLAMSVTDRLHWLVTDGDGKQPAGVTMRENELSVSPSAKPGQITVSVSYDEDGDGTAERHVASHKLTLERTGTEKVLVLRRGEELFPGGVDTAYGKEGTAITMTYVPVLLDPATGNATEVPAGQFTWVGAQGSFTVEAAAEPGVYTAPITVIHEGQSVSLTAQVTVYPDITSLHIEFDDGDTDTKDEQYRFPLPLQAAKTYYGTLMAKVTRGGKTVKLPFTELGLTDYEIDIYTPLTGVYTVYDKATGRFALTIDPTAESNSMKNPDKSKGETEFRYLRFIFSYYPGQEEYDSKQLFMLSRESSAVTTAVLRQGTGVGSKFVFETTRGDVTLNTAAGVLSNCYALELLDQYGNAVTSEKVAWTLAGSPTTGSGSQQTSLITLVDPGEAVTGRYPLYQSIRRLRIAPETPENTYELTLTASAAGFSRSIDIHLTVTGPQKLASVTLTGSSSELIPKWYAKYNSTTLNNETRTTSYVAVAQDTDGNELDASLCDFAWSVTTANGNAPSGVSISSNTKTPTAATLTIDRRANPTGSNDADRLKIIVTATPKGGGDPLRSETRLALTRGTLVPTLMTINGPSSHQMQLDDPNKALEYTFDLVNQYNSPVSNWDATTVKWSVSGKLPSFITVDTSSRSKDSRGYPSAKVTIKNPGVDTRASFTLTASIEFAEASTTSGKAVVYASRTVTVTVGAPAAGGLGGDILVEEVPITTSSVTPSTNKNGTTGTSTLSAEDVDTLTKTTATGTLTIAPKNTSGLTSITVTFPASLARELAKKGNSLKIQTALGTLTLPRAALELPSTLRSDFSITILNQDNKLAVSYKAGTSSLYNLPAAATLQAPVKGASILTAKGLSDEQLKKAVINNGTLTVELSSQAEFTFGAKGKVFSDTQNHWAKSAVEFVTARDLFQGTSETTFSPNADMTRSMVVTVLHRLESTPTTSAANLFSDVPGNTWYTTAVIWANDNGIVMGTGDGFLPNDPVTREQLATILYRYMATQNYDTTKRASLSSFSDSAKVSSWAREAMEWAVSAGLINGKTGGILDPGGNASRAEVATIFERLVRAMTPSV